MPVEYKTEAGFYLEGEPVQCCSVADTAEFYAALSRNVMRGNPRIPTPSRDSYKHRSPVVLKYAKVRSWAQLYRESTCWSVGKTETHFTLTPYKPRSDRGLEEDQKNMQTYPISKTTLEQFLHAVVNKVQETGVRNGSEVRIVRRKSGASE